MSTIDNIKEQFQQSQAVNGSGQLKRIEQTAFDAFDRWGIPTVRHEEWKYTRISSLFNKEFTLVQQAASLTKADLDAVRPMGHEEVNELVFVNGLYSPGLSTIRSAELIILPLKEAAENEYKDVVAKHLGHSSNYLKDGIHALNTAFIHGGVFIHVKNRQIVEHPVYIYNVTDARTANILSQPRSLVHIGEGAQIQFAETYATIGASESFTNQVMEVVVEKDALVDYYKIQNDSTQTNHVSTTHFRLVGKSVVHSVTISLNGGIVRNNLNMVLEAEHSEAGMYGLYFLKDQAHVDNHTVVDNVKPHSLSNELYKGVIDDSATAVFNGKIFVQPQAQKTNAFQSNKNILLSDGASVNTKPQLEIFADDVKCSHGCTVGRLDDEGLFYLRSRGISKDRARALLVNAFAMDILEHIKPAELRTHVQNLIYERLGFHP
jgi:Fe-S cluster assembly protein SufD